MTDQELIDKLKTQLDAKDEAVLQRLIDNNDQTYGAQLREIKEALMSPGIPDWQKLMTNITNVIDKIKHGQAGLGKEFDPKIGFSTEIIQHMNLFLDKENQLLPILLPMKNLIKQAKPELEEEAKPTPTVSKMRF